MDCLIKSVSSSQVVSRGYLEKEYLIEERLSWSQLRLYLLLLKKSRIPRRTFQALNTS